ncbi:MAG: hypothetical protein KAH44_32045, partial [Oricola sp.]|nr:hypothetical protein [Oricola sp.]
MSGGAILTINAGSSSIKFSIYTPGDEPAERLGGEVEDIGDDDARLIIESGPGEGTNIGIGKADHTAALGAILRHAGDGLHGAPVAGVGHRI